jgi:hypothetical protein
MIICRSLAGKLCDRKSRSWPSPQRRPATAQDQAGLSSKAHKYSLRVAPAFVKSFLCRTTYLEELQGVNGVDSAYWLTFRPRVWYSLC